MFDKTIFDRRERLKIEGYQLNRYNFDTMTIGTNLNGKYAPMYSLAYREEIPHIKGGYMYFKPKPKIYGGVSTYSDLFNEMNSLHGTNGFTFTVNALNHNLTAACGYLGNKDGDILLILCTESYEAGFHPDRLKLFISSEFRTNELYKNVWKKIEKEYVLPIQDEGIDVEYTTSAKIEELIFGEGPEMNFHSISELEQIKSQMHEYFWWFSSYDEGDIVGGHDYVAPKLVKPGYNIQNLKAQDERFQPVLWKMITSGVYSLKHNENISLEKFFTSVEKEPVAASYGVKVNVDDVVIDLVYSVSTQTFKDRDRDIETKLILSKVDLVEKCSRNINDTLLALQNYVNFVSENNEGTTPGIIGQIEDRGNVFESISISGEDFPPELR